MNGQTLLTCALWIAAVGCGGATASTDPHDSGSLSADAGSTNGDARHDSDAAEDASAVADAGPDGAAKIAACNACLQARCAAGYATCTASATCMNQLNDTTLCRSPSQDAIPGELVLCYGTCDVCLCHP